MLLRATSGSSSSRLGLSQKDGLPFLAAVTSIWRFKAIDGDPPIEGRPEFSGSTAMTGAQFEILIDGKPRSYRDIKAAAMEARCISQEPKPEQRGRGERPADRRDKRRCNVPLTMRPTGLGHGVYKNDIDYSVFSGEWLNNVDRR
jgi:hypothetical protein